MPAPPYWMGLGRRLTKPPLHPMEPLGAPRPQALGVPWGLPEAPSYSIKASQAPVARLTPHFPDSNQGWEMSCWPPAAAPPPPATPAQLKTGLGPPPWQGSRGPHGPQDSCLRGPGGGRCPLLVCTLPCPSLSSASARPGCRLEATTLSLAGWQAGARAGEMGHGSLPKAGMVTGCPEVQARPLTGVLGPSGLHRVKSPQSRTPCWGPRVPHMLRPSWGECRLCPSPAFQRQHLCLTFTTERCPEAAGAGPVLGSSAEPLAPGAC